MPRNILLLHIKMPAFELVTSTLDLLQCSVFWKFYVYVGSSYSAKKYVESICTV